MESLLSNFLVKKKTAFAKGKVLVAQDPPKGITAGNPCISLLSNFLVKKKTAFAKGKVLVAQGSSFSISAGNT